MNYSTHNYRAQSRGPPALTRGRDCPATGAVAGAATVARSGDPAKRVRLAGSSSCGGLGGGPELESARRALLGGLATPTPGPVPTEQELTLGAPIPGESRMPRLGARQVLRGLAPLARPLVGVAGASGLEGHLLQP